MIKLGSRVIDTISGFTGIVTARHEYLYGCVRVTVTPETLKDGKPIDAEWFDEHQVRVLKEKQVEFKAEKTASGGPQDPPPALQRP